MEHWGPNDITMANEFFHKMEEMSQRDQSFELGVNYLIKQTNGFALPDIQGIPTENERAGVLPFF